MMKTKTIRQTVLFKVSSHEVFEALMDSKKHSKFSGAKASISRKIGGKFSVYNGYAAGKNLEIIPDKKIIQSWCASDWDEAAISTVVFEFSTIKSGSRLQFTHSQIPAEHAESIAQGWKDFYWKPMKEMFSK